VRVRDGRTSAAADARRSAPAFKAPSPAVDVRSVPWSTTWRPPPRFRSIRRPPSGTAIRGAGTFD